MAANSSGGTRAGAGGAPEGHDPETALLAALAGAPYEGVSVSALVVQTGMCRRWIYYRLHELAAAGVVVQTARGHWRIAGPG
jgi:S-DNA-T family DNA segregation ATPase FtsK/SpoIIIE